MQKGRRKEEKHKTTEKGDTSENGVSREIKKAKRWKRPSLDHWPAIYSMDGHIKTTQTRMLGVEQRKCDKMSRDKIRFESC